MNKSQIDNRQKDNSELVEILSDLVKKHPEQRFHQILRNYGFISENGLHPGTDQPLWVNDFNSEPEVILSRVKEAIKKHNK